MSRFIWSLAFAVVIPAAPSISAAQTPTTPVQPQILTTGMGEVRMSPDRATIFIGVRTRGATAAIAGADNARRQRAVLDTLRALGETAEDLSTVNYNVAPEYQYAQNGEIPPRVTGYTVTNTVRAEVRKLEDVGRLIDGALGKGANEISSLQFYSSKADSARRLALMRAVVNARADADALAAAAGGSVGALIELSSSESAPRPQPRVMAAQMAAAKVTPVEAGEQSFFASVSARWAYLSRRD